MPRCSAISAVLGREGSHACCSATCSIPHRLCCSEGQCATTTSHVMATQAQDRVAGAPCPKAARPSACLPAASHLRRPSHLARLTLAPWSRVLRHAAIQRPLQLACHPPLWMRSPTCGLPSSFLEGCLCGARLERMRAAVARDGQRHTAADCGGGSGHSADKSRGHAYGDGTQGANATGNWWAAAAETLPPRAHAGGLRESRAAGPREARSGRQAHVAARTHTHTHR